MDGQNLKAFFAAARQRQDYWADRIAKEIEYAEKLQSAEPAAAPEWPAALAAARTAVAKAPAIDAALCAQVETMLAPFAAAAKSHTVFCVGHAHIDMNWMWSWPETVHATNDTLITMLNLLDEFPKFVFSQSQASVYRIIEQYHPELLERIAARIKEGRWEVTASHWVETDKNIVGSEALCRHLLYTRAYMQKLFGLQPEDVTIDWSPDTFGHSATVPNYLVRGGVRHLYMHRPGVYSDKREVFWWEGTDGSRVLVRNDIHNGYSGSIDSTLGSRCLEHCQSCGVKPFMFVYGVGDHGGGPTRRALETLEDLATWPIFPTFRHAAARAYFAELEKEKNLPVIRGEFNTENAGCYTSQSLIKKSNRLAEERLFDAEFVSSLTAAAGIGTYPAEKLQGAWRETLFSHFHDILPGSCVHDSRTYMHGKFQETMATTSMLETMALRAFAAQIDTASLPYRPDSNIDVAAPYRHSPQGCGAGAYAGNGNISGAATVHRSGDKPLMVFNYTASAREEILETTIWDYGTPAPGICFRNLEFSVVTPDGRVIPAQKIAEGNLWAHDFVKISFPVSVPAFGYTTYLIREGRECGETAATALRSFSRTHHCWYSRIERNQYGMENSCIRLEIDPHTGGIRSLVDRKSGAVIISEKENARTLEFGYERPHTMTAWLVDHTGAVSSPEVTELERRLNGPYRISYDVRMKFGKDSEFTLTYELRADDPQLYISLKGRWGERGDAQIGVPSLRLRLPIAAEDVSARYEIPFGEIARDFNQDDEVPALQWAEVVGTQNGRQVAGLLLNDSKNGHALNGNTFYLSLIRGSYEPDVLPEIGEHEINLAFRPFGGTIPADAAAAAARVFNHPLRAVGATVQKGRFPAQSATAQLEGAGLVLSGWKYAEDGHGLIFRVYEATGKQSEGTLTLAPEFWGEIISAVAVDTLERDTAAEKAPAVAGAQVKFTVPACGITALRICTANIK